MRSLHFYISLFFLPVFIFYAFSGFMFLVGKRSRGLAKKEVISANWPIDEAAQLKWAQDYLVGKGYKEMPPLLVRSQEGQFFWGLSGRLSIFLQEIKPQEQIVVTVYQPTVYSRLIALHANRFKGGVFQIFALVFCLSWIFSYLGILKSNNRLGNFIYPLGGAGFLLTFLICWFSW